MHEDSLEKRFSDARHEAFSTAQEEYAAIVDDTTLRPPISDEKENLVKLNDSSFMYLGYNYSKRETKELKKEPATRTSYRFVRPFSIFLAEKTSIHSSYGLLGASTVDIRNAAPLRLPLHATTTIHSFLKL